MDSSAAASRLVGAFNSSFGRKLNPETWEGAIAAALRLRTESELLSAIWYASVVWSPEAHRKITPSGLFGPKLADYLARAAEEWQRRHGRKPPPWRPEPERLAEVIPIGANEPARTRKAPANGSGGAPGTPHETESGTSQLAGLELEPIAIVDCRTETERDAHEWRRHLAGEIDAEELLELVADKGLYRGLVARRAEGNGKTRDDAARRLFPDWFAAQKGKRSE